MSDIPCPSRRTLRVLIVVGVRLYREGLTDMLSRQDGLSVVGVESDRRGAVAAIQRQQPDVVLLDTAVIDTYPTMADIRHLAPEVRVVALGVGDQEEDVLLCAEAGVAGYVTRDASLEDLVAVVESAARGVLHCSPEVAGSLLRRLAALAADRGTDPSSPRLTTRESQIVRLIEEDLSNKEIAVRLGIEVATVKNHVHNVLEKLNIHRRSEAARVLGRSPRWTRSVDSQLTKR